MIKKLCLLILLTFCTTNTFAQSEMDVADMRSEINRIESRLKNFVNSDQLNQSDIEAWEAEVEGLYVHLETIQNDINDKCEAFHRNMTGRLVQVENKLATAEQRCQDRINTVKMPLLDEIKELRFDNMKLKEAIPMRINEEKVKLGKTIQGLQKQLQEQQRMLYEFMQDDQVPLRNKVEALEADKKMIKEEYAELIIRKQQEHDKQMAIFQDKLQELNQQLLVKDSEIKELKEKNKELSSTINKLKKSQK